MTDQEPAPDPWGALRAHLSPSAEDATTATARRRRPARQVVIAAAALLVTVAGVALLAGTRPAEHSAQPNVDAPTTVTSTALAVSAEPASSQPGGTITTETGRFELGASNDRVVLGDWDCDGEETPALLVMATGEVFAFASWADDSRTVEGRLVRTIRDAADVAATQGDADGCTELEVRRFDGSTVTLEVPS